MIKLNFKKMKPVFVEEELVAAINSINFLKEASFRSLLDEINPLKDKYLIKNVDASIRYYLARTRELISVMKKTGLIKNSDYNIQQKLNRLSQLFRWIWP